MSGTTSILKNTILRAGAGAGKTTTLTATFLKFASDFKEQNKKFPRIVVTTFTRKATQELKERLLKKALDEKRDDLFQFVSSKSQVQISTIHGVLSLFLSRYGASIGLTPDYKILSESEIRKNARKIMRKYLVENPQLQELLEEYDFPVLEGALLKYFGENVIFPDMKFIEAGDQEVEAKKALADLSSRLRRVCTEIQQETTNDKWIEYCQSLAAFPWQVQDGQWQKFFEHLDSFLEHAPTKPQFRKATPPFAANLNDELEEIRKQIKKFSEKACYRPEYWEKHQQNCALFQELAKNFCQDFLQSKLEKGLLSMSDLETLSFKIIKDAPEAATKFSQEWDFWMVDEYQDTSPVQVELLNHLIGDKPLFVVGDPQQSIYLFRGARSEVFQEKVETIQNQKGDVQVKLTNYRSSPEVLEFFNHYFTRLSGQFAAMTPAPDKVRKGNADPVVQVLLSETGDEDDISAEVLNAVARAQELLKEGLSPEQICILGRTHKTLEQIARVAQDHGVPVQLHSGSGFYERREVMDALAILKFLVNPHDNGNFIALLRSPWLALSDSEIASYCHSYRHSFWKEAQKTIETLPDLHPLKILKGLLVLSETKGLSWTLKRALIDLGFFDYSARIDGTGRREANLWKVVAMLSQEERRPGFNYLDFLDSSLDALSTDEGGEDADATPVIEPKRVNLMTVHASKGLQFEHVILPGMGQDPRASHAPVLSIRETDGLWTLKVRDPETQSMSGSILSEQITEELRERESEEFNRVLYVALTRAKSGVTLLWDKDIGKKSWASQCPLNLEEGFHQEKDFSYVVRVDNLHPEKMQEESISNKDLRPAWQPSETVERRKYISVTELVSPLEKESSAAAYSPKASQLGPSLARAQQGTNAHRLFEALKYTSYEDLLGICEEDLKKPLQFLNSSEQIPLLKIIEQGFVEYGFALTVDDSLMQGQIDLWGIVDGCLWMVDYKTGSQKYSETAFKQLEAYAWALYKMNRLEGVQEIRLAVVYPMDEVVKVKTLDSLEQLDLRMLETLRLFSLV
ncbi:UvrD-helicase domain-containing protein [Bdellovibrio reynosensis]|uniref:DNA 3'-5' helicase n=1 Tax=Bdellovibrio reynosensis TaxID=2835041 RepID=A0ABY4C838_9BACT|nr:UvrD-helicase domain-containing protein [Bdellovibrio reynosensis]UOF01092.1 UvrD-helicase domain-containing protein [Bdellovibrio reynosensis]